MEEKNKGINVFPFPSGIWILYFYIWKKLQIQRDEAAFTLRC